MKNVQAVSLLTMSANSQRVKNATVVAATSVKMLFFQFIFGKFSAVGKSPKHGNGKTDRVAKVSFYYERKRKARPHRNGRTF